jgi:hypothetical protein
MAWMSSLGAWFLGASLVIVLLLGGLILFGSFIPWPANFDDAKKGEAIGDMAAGLVMLAVGLGVLGAFLRRRG